MIFLFMSLFLAADACLNWSLPSFTEQQVSPHRLPMQYWLKNHWLSSNTPHTNSIPNSAILCNNYISSLNDLCACVHVKKKGVVKEVIVLQRAVRIALCDFKPGKKRWAGALLSEKCCCFVQKPNHLEVMQIWTSYETKKSPDGQNVLLLLLLLLLLLQMG